MWKLILLHVAMLITTTIKHVQSQNVTLQGTQQLRVYFNNMKQLKLIKSHVVQSDFDYLGMIDNKIDLYVSAKQSLSFKEFLQVNRIKYHIVSYDIYEQILEEYEYQEIQRAKRSARRKKRENFEYDFSSYLNYIEIVQYMGTIANNHQGMVKMINIGKSYEERDMFLLHISKPGRTEKPAIFIDAGIHAREWIAPATALYIIDQLVKEENNDLLNNVDFYILPLVNPDGYQYTHDDIKNRLWRKTRSRIPDSNCRGVDANRNFDYAWTSDKKMNQPCMDTFAGYAPFSEPETRNFRDFFLSKKESIKIYLTFHSWGQLLLYPWAHQKGSPPNKSTLRKLAKKVQKAIWGFSNNKYTIGNFGKKLLLAGGTSVDWAMIKGGIELPYLIELPPAIYVEGFEEPVTKKSGSKDRYDDPPPMKFKFTLPPKYISSVGRETFEGLKVFIGHLEPKSSGERSCRVAR